MTPLKRLLAAALIGGFSLSAFATVSASLDRDHIAPGETVQLQLQSDRNPKTQPDLTALAKDFTVLGTSSGSSIQIINGHMSSTSQLSLALSPKHDGTIRIPPLSWGDEQSPALSLTVDNTASPSPAQPASRATNNATNGSSHVFVTTTVDHRQPYVQSAVLLTVRVYTDQTLYQASLDLPASSEVLAQQIGKDKQYSETRDGHSYQVIERQYLLAPQHSGTLSLAGPILDASVAEEQDTNPFGNDPFFNNMFGQLQLPRMVTSTRPLHLQAKAVELKVLPRPASATGKTWLPAQKLTLNESWTPADARIHAGEPLTRHLSLSALGLSGAQLPELDSLMPLPDGIKPYPDKAHIEDQPQGTTIRGQREQDIALIATQAGHYTLPAMHLAWWDTTADAPREATLPARQIEVLPAAPGAAAPLAPAAPSAPSEPAHPPSAAIPHAISPSVGLAAGIALGLLCLGLLLVWRRTRRQPPAKIKHHATEPGGSPDKAPNSQPTSQPAARTSVSAPQPQASFNNFLQACRDNAPQAARQQLLAWAASTWPEQAPSGLNALARRLDDEALQAALRQLDRACYTDRAWDGAALARLLPAPPTRASRASAQAGLPELYA